MPKSNHGSKSAEVRALLASGVAASQIAEQVGCSIGLVYNVKSRLGTAPKRGPGRPRKVRANDSNAAATGTATAGVEGFIETVRRGEEERQQLRDALQRIAAVLAEVQ